MLKTIIFILVSLIATAGWATTDESKIPYTVVGGDTQSFTPSMDGLKRVTDKNQYDVIVVGAGLAGLTSTIFLTNHHKKVLVLEKEAAVGGLASGTVTSDGISTDRGAAYWTDPYEEEQEILNHINLGDYEKKDAIVEPADSYFLNGHLYKGIWEEKTMAQLPASFALFKLELKRENDEGLIPNQPLEENDTTLDAMTAAQWINAMPAKMEARYNAIDKAAVENCRAQATVPTNTNDNGGGDEDHDPDKHNPCSVVSAWERFAQEKDSLLGKDKMDDVLKLMDLYCRSALGTTADGVSALAFGNFYISEIFTRYTTPYGTAQAAMNMSDLLKKAKAYVKVRTSAPVAKISDGPQGVTVDYIYKNKVHEVKAAYLVFAAQVGLAPKLIDNFASLAPEKAKTIANIKYANYSVHTVNIQGQPYRASYDTWTRPADYSDLDFTDVILAEWKALDGYKNYQDFKVSPPVENGVLTIYHPISPDWNISKDYSDSDAIKVAKYAVHRLLQLYSPMIKEESKTNAEFDITSVSTNRWPISVHIATPGHFINEAKILRQPVGHIYFGNNNIGTPAFEEALFRGHCAADNVLVKLDPTINLKAEEPWTQCPIEK